MKKNEVKKSFGLGLSSLFEENNVEVFPVAKEDSQLTDPKAMLNSKIDKVRRVVGTLKVDFVLLGGYLVDLKPYVHDVWSDRKARFCKDIYELAQQEFNLCKTTVKNVIGVATRFGESFIKVKETYKDYNYSQLVEMLPLTDKQLELVSPAMTQQEIRAIKKVELKKSQLPDQVSNSPPLNPLECQFELTNDNQRLEFLSKYYKSWGVWLDIPELELKVYRIGLNNGDFIVLLEQNSFDRVHTSVGPRISYCLLKQGTSPEFYGVNFNGISDGEYLTYMRSRKPKVICPFKCKNFSEYKEMIERVKSDV